MLTLILKGKVSHHCRRKPQLELIYSLLYSLWRHMMLATAWRWISSTSLIGTSSLSLTLTVTIIPDPNRWVELVGTNNQWFSVGHEYSAGLDRVITSETVAGLDTSILSYSPKSVLSAISIGEPWSTLAQEHARHWRRIVQRHRLEQELRIWMGWAKYNTLRVRN